MKVLCLLIRCPAFFLACWLMGTPPVLAQFREEFSQPTARFQARGVPGWNAITGDGEGVFTQQIKDGVVTMRLDGRPDKRNIWYAFIHRDVSSSLATEQLDQPGKGLRISARVKPSHGPRRVNLYLKSLATGQDFLREFDLPRAGEWYDISMTTDTFRHEAGQSLLGQISFMDWGNTDVYELAVDYLRVEVVDRHQAGPDQGQPQRYRPPLAATGTFEQERTVAAAGTVDRQYPTLNLAEFVQDGQSSTPLLLVDGTRLVAFRWDFSDLRGKRAKGAGQLEFYTDAVYRLAQSPKDFGEIRLCEILAGPADWTRANLTYAKLVGDQPEASVLNEQTIVDAPLTPGRGSKTIVTISQAVMQRLLDGQTRGIVIKPLGLISGLLLGSETGPWATRLRFNAE